MRNRRTRWRPAAMEGGTPCPNPSALKNSVEAKPPAPDAGMGRGAVDLRRQTPPSRLPCSRPRRIQRLCAGGGGPARRTVGSGLQRSPHPATGRQTGRRSSRHGSTLSRSSGPSRREAPAIPGTGARATRGPRVHDSTMVGSSRSRT